MIKAKPLASGEAVSKSQKSLSALSGVSRSPTSARKKSRIRSSANLRRFSLPSSAPISIASGVKTEPLGAILPTAFPPQRISPLSDSVKIWCVPLHKDVRRRSISGATVCAAVASNALASRPVVVASMVKLSPSSCPMRTSSTKTSPLSFIVAFIYALAPMPLSSLLVRRSTNRSVRFSCSASDSLSSTSRATFTQ